MVRVVVKWNKTTYDVDLDPSLGVASFKAKIKELTAVPEDRQKLMAKGCWPGTLKDDCNLTTCIIGDGALIMLMGTADVVAGPAVKSVFAEDLSADQIAQKGALLLPVGLENTGNTCYLNSTVQCLKSISELRPLLARSSGLSAALDSLLSDLDRSGNSVTPYRFIASLRSQFPQFAEAQQGRFMQQDAEELYSALLAAMQQQHIDLRNVLSVELDETVLCKESAEEPALVQREVVNKLICNIQGGPDSAIQIDHLLDGLRLGMEATIVKHSTVLGRDAAWTKVQRIASLPKHLCIQFMRFYWKPTPESRDHTGIKCKILRPVKFPETLDLFDLCSPTLQQVLLKSRQEASQARDLKGNSSTTGLQSPPLPLAMDVEDDEHALQTALQMSMSEDPAPVGEDVGEGLYELSALVTHKGRSADSGHYKAYVREEMGSQVWRCFDDAKVSELSSEDVLKLHGCGDSDMAYLCFYQRKDARL